MEFSQITHQRRSVKSYHPNTTISDDELAALFEQVSLTPSAFNLQHWRFVVVRDGSLKAAMQEAAWGQRQVGDSAAAILVAGKLNAQEDADLIFAETPEDVRAQMIPMIDGFYGNNVQLKRDEAIRSASMAAMTLMYAAKDRGYETGPMIGFDVDAMAKILHLPEEYVPVMLVVLGKGDSPSRARAFRHPLEELVRLEHFDGPGLEGNALRDLVHVQN